MSSSWLYGVMIGMAALVLGSCASSDSADDSGRDRNAPQAACAAPVTFVEPTTAVPGQQVRVTAMNMVDGCDDQGLGVKVTVLKDQRIMWSQGTDDVELAVVDADDETLVAEATITVPADAVPGAAEIAVGRSLPAEFVVAAE